MQYSDDYLRQVLPPENPPLELVPPNVVRETGFFRERGRFEDGELLARSAFWTYAIFSELMLGNFVSTRPVDDAANNLPNYLWFLKTVSKSPDVIVGLYDAEAEEGGFGLCLNVPQWSGPPFFVFDYLKFPRLNWGFPFAVRAVTTELHTPPNPTNATTTCWAKCNATGLWGIVTAGHAIGSSAPGLAVPLDDGTTGISYRSFWPLVDAAFVLTTTPAPLPPALPVVSFPSAGKPVSVETQKGPVSRTIASACNSQGFFETRSHAILFYLDQPCAPGDSGSLIKLTSGEACGIYNGAQPSPATGGTSGLALNFSQAMFALDTSPYL